MANDSSRLWNLDASQLPCCFNTTHPQEMSWQACNLTDAKCLKLHSSLFRKPSHTAPSKLQRTKIDTGMPDWASVRTATSIHSSNVKTRSPTCKHLDNSAEMASPRSAANPSNLAQHRTSSVQWVRRSCGWGTGILASAHTQVPQTSNWHDKPPDGQSKTHHQRGCAQHPQRWQPSSTTLPMPHQLHHQQMLPSLTSSALPFSSSSNQGNALALPTTMPPSNQRTSGFISDNVDLT